jgi:hypothetical protein
VDTPFRPMTKATTEMASRATYRVMLRYLMPIMATVQTAQHILRTEMESIGL